MAAIHDVLWFSALGAEDVRKCLYFYKENFDKPLAGERFASYSLQLGSPRLARALMRGFIDVPAEKGTAKAAQTFDSDIYLKQFKRLIKARKVHLDKAGN